MWCSLKSSNSRVARGTMRAEFQLWGVVFEAHRLLAQGPSRTCNESEEEEEVQLWGVARASPFILSISTLEVTQGQILSQSPTDATRFWWHLYGS